eukprot:Gb_29711 [translate_table: standard]
MDQIIQLRQQHNNLMNSLYQEGYLDEHFAQLEQLQDDSNPDFVMEVLSLFFEDSRKLLDNLGKALNREPVDFKKVDAYMHHFKGSSSSVGAQRVKNECIALRGFCEEKLRDGCLQCLQKLKQEHYLLKNKLDNLFQLEKQISAARGTNSVTG